MDSNIFRIYLFWIAAFFFLSVTFIGNGIWFNNLMRNYVATERNVDHIQKVIKLTKDLLADNQSIHICLRDAYLSDSLLEEVLCKKSEISLKEAKIRQSISEIKSLIHQSHELAPEINSIVEKLNRIFERITFDSRSESNVNARRLKTARQLLAESKDLIAMMEAKADRLLVEHRSKQAEYHRDMKFTLLIATGTGIFLLVIISLILKREINIHKRFTNKLEQQVAERTIQLEHYSNELQRSNRELQDFAFVASHDLQEPLRKIMAFGDRLESRFSSQLGEGADYIKRMHKAAHRMSKLINNLLDFSRVTTKANPFEQIDLNTVLTDVLEDLEITIEEKKATIEFNALPSLEADETQMRQLFQNLVRNAIKFVADGIDPNIKIRSNKVETDNAHDRRGWYEISIEDNGIGIDSNHKERIFAPFQRLHAKNEYEGTGIGLSVCRRIVERHGGRIVVESILGKGSTFKVIIPSTQIQIDAEKGHSDE